MRCDTWLCPVEKLMTPRTTGILGVHLWSRPCAVEALQEMAQARNLQLLFDAAQAFGCSYKGAMIGNFGNAEVFSFHATKFFHTFDGGAIVTNDIVVEVEAQATGLHRDVLIEVLHAENVLARRYFWPGCHRLEPYRTLFPHAGEMLPRTEEVANRILVLPTGSAVSEEDIETICGILRAAVANADAVHAYLLYS
jgi:dTDP-4-amino-4,6-dideoxygalactose transaminase